MTLATPLPAPPLRIHGLHKRYGDVVALRDVELEPAPGRVTAVLGPNGAGKTTLLKAILGLIRPDRGSIEVLGLPVADPASRTFVGYMPQLPRFPGALSARQLAAMLDDLRGFGGTPDRELLDAFSLEPWLDKPFRTLSGGTRQKVNAALAFRYDAPVLVLDEPTASLDPVAARTLKDKVRRERDAGRTVLLTSHDLAQVQALADDVVFLLEGAVTFRGPLARLLAATGHTDLEGAIATLMESPASVASPFVREEVA